MSEQYGSIQRTLWRVGSALGATVVVAAGPAACAVILPDQAVTGLAADSCPPHPYVYLPDPIKDLHGHYENSTFVDGPYENALHMQQAIAEAAAPLGAMVLQQDRSGQISAGNKTMAYDTFGKWSARVLVGRTAAGNSVRAKFRLSSGNANSDHLSLNDLVEVVVFTGKDESGGPFRQYACMVNGTGPVVWNFTYQDQRGGEYFSTTDVPADEIAVSAKRQQLDRYLAMPVA